MDGKLLPQQCSVRRPPSCRRRMAQNWLVQQHQLKCTKVASPMAVRWLWGAIPADAGTAAAAAAFAAAPQAAAAPPHAAALQPVTRLPAPSTAPARAAASSSRPSASTAKPKAQPRVQAAAGPSRAAPPPAAPALPAAAEAPLCMPLGGVLHVRCFGCARYIPATAYQEHTQRCPLAGEEACVDAWEVGRRVVILS